MDYVRRIVDEKIDVRCKAFDAICIVGPKGCGKSRTASERVKTVIEFQDEEKRDGYLLTVENAPSLMLKYEKPILFDEWQDAPKIWGTIRKACDETDAVGEYYLTGSTSRKTSPPHTGTGRITTLQMYPMTFYESGLSNGSISLLEVISNPEFNIDGSLSQTKIEDLIFSICRGGWPRAVLMKDRASSLEIAKDYFSQIYEKDISAIDNVKRNPVWTRAILLSYARNAATAVKPGVILADVKANYSISEVSFYDYVDALERLYVVQDIDAWCPQIRSKTAIRASKKKIFVDPSIAVAALGLSPEYFYSDFDMFGHLFENAVIRDLLAYASKHDAKVRHYRDDFGLEVDVVYELSSGDYALIEIKTGTSKLEDAEKNLLKFKNLIETYNKRHPEVPYRLPKALIVICGTLDMAYTTKNGVKVIPIGCLKD